VPGADTYATVAELRAYAAKRGATIPASGTEGDAACEVLLIKACDYLGDRTSPSQPLAWPRFGVTVNGYEIPSDTIPTDIKNAQCQLAIDAQTIDLMPNIDPATQTGAVIERTIDVLTTRYAEPVQPLTSPRLSRANGWLAKYLSSGQGQIKLVRG
jgi:hypothetical protein